jgi:hypothetical protein
VWSVESEHSPLIPGTQRNAPRADAFHVVSTRPTAPVPAPPEAKEGGNEKDGKRMNPSPNRRGSNQTLAASRPAPFLAVAVVGGSARRHRRSNRQPCRRVADGYGGADDEGDEEESISGPGTAFRSRPPRLAVADHQSIIIGPTQKGELLAPYRRSILLAPTTGGI